MAQPPITPISLPRISGSDLENKGVTGLPDTPNLSAPEMQRKFDEIGREVIPPIVNNLSSAAEGYINDLYEKERVNEDHISSLGTLLIDTEKRVDKAEGDIRILNDACDNLEENKVDKVEGKGLSTNDYTNTDKANLSTSFENSREALSNANIALTNSNEAFQKAQDAQASVATFGTKLEDVRQRAEKSLTSVIAEDENKNEYESYSIKTIDYDRITGKTTVSAITTHLVIPNADEKFRNNLMYGKIEGTSPLTAKTLSGTTELTLKGRCEQDGIPTPSAPIQIEYAHANDSTNLLDGSDIKNWQTYQTSKVLRKVYKLKPNTSYTISQTRNYEESNANIFAVSGNDIGFTPTTAGSGCTVGNPRTIVSDSNGYITVGSRVEAGDCVMLNEGTSALPYEPYYKATKVESYRFANLDYYEMLNDYQKNYLSANEAFWKNDKSFVFVNPYDSDLHITTVSVCYFNGTNWYTRLVRTSSVDADVNRGTSLPAWLNSLWVSGTFTNSAGTVMKTICNPNIASGFLRTEVPLPCDLLGLPNAQDELKEGWVTRRVGIATSLELSQLNWVKGSLAFYANGFTSPAPSTAYVPNMLCNILPTVSRSDYDSGKSGITTNVNGAIMFKDDTTFSSLTVDEFKAKLVSLNAMVVYELATSTNAPADRIELPTYNEQTTFKADYCEISADVAQNGLDVIDERTKEVYAEEETVIGTWCGEILYRKVIKTTTPTAADTAISVSAIVDATYKVKKVEGIIEVNAANLTPINYYYDSNNYVATWIGTDGIRMKVGSVYANKPCEIVVEYTKASASDRSAEPMMLAEEVEE